MSHYRLYYSFDIPFNGETSSTPIDFTEDGKIIFLDACYDIVDTPRMDQLLAVLPHLEEERRQGERTPFIADGTVLAYIGVEK